MSFFGVGGIECLENFPRNCRYIRENAVNRIPGKFLEEDLVFSCIFILLNSQQDILVIWDLFGPEQ